MSQTPVCRKCMVAIYLTDFMIEYKDFISFLEGKQLDLISDHARGYCRGQLTLAKEVVADLSALVPRVKIETGLRVKSDKGL